MAHAKSSADAVPDGNLIDVLRQLDAIGIERRRDHGSTVPSARRNATLSWVPMTPRIHLRAPGGDDGGTAARGCRAGSDRRRPSAEHDGHRSDLEVQPGNRQPRSRATSARRVAAGTTRVLRPTSSTDPSPACRIARVTRRRPGGATFPRKRQRSDARPRSRPFLTARPVRRAHPRLPDRPSPVVDVHDDLIAIAGRTCLESPARAASARRTSASARRCRGVTSSVSTRACFRIRPLRGTADRRRPGGRAGRPPRLPA